MILVPTSPCSALPDHGSQVAGVREEPGTARCGAASDLLLRALGGKKSPALAHELSALGSDIAPFLLQVLTQGGVPVGDDPKRLVLEIPPELQESVLAALASLPREPLLQCLRASAAATDLEVRAASLRVLGRIGTNEHLELLASLASPIGSDGLVPPRVRAAFQEALALVLARDRKAFSQLAELYARLPPALIFPMVRAAQAESPLRAIELFASLLGTRADADLFLLAEMARLADAKSMAISRAVRVKARRYLGERDLERLQAAATLAGALDDYEAVPDLTRLLGHHDSQVVRSARTALKRIARKDLGRRPEPWTSWYQAEQDWWSTKSSGAARDLGGNDSVQAAAAILELGRRRIRRDEAALLLAEGLLRPETDLVRTCCQALGYLRSPLAVPALELAQSHPDGTVRESAREALESIREPQGDATAVRTAHKTPGATRHRTAGE